MAYNNVNNLAEDFFKSIDIIVTERLQNVSYDSTIICTIIDDSNSKNGVYAVSNDSIKFDAKCENQTYKNGDQVRVTILNGDMTQDKYIVGKYVVDNNIKPISFVSPLEQIMDMTGNLIPKETAAATYGLSANGDQTVREIWKLDLTKASAQSVNLSASDIFDTVYLSADFKSLLSNSNVKSGNYGLALTLLLELNDGTYASKVIKLDSSMMFGNPYAFSIYSQQQIKFDIASLGKVSALHLSLYQDKNFKTFANKDLVPAVLGEVQTDTLLVKNIAVGFGSDLSKLDDNTLKLYTTDSLLYRNEKTSSVDNRKHLRFAWYNKDENNKYLGFSDGIYAPGYDEQIYLEQVNAQKRLQAQQNSDVPNDENALRIVAEIKEVKPIIENFAATTFKELNTLLTSFSERMRQLPGAANLFVTEDGSNGAIITVSAASEAIKTGINNLYDYYMAVFKYASQFNKLPDTVGETETKPVEELAWTGNVPSFITIQQSKATIFTAKDNLLTELQKIITGNENKSYPEFQSDYDLYVQRITKQFEVLIKYWEQIDIIWTDNNDILIQNYISRPSILYEYNPVAINPQENKYCIYWYRYDPKAEGDMFMDKGWQRLLYKTPEDELKSPPVVTYNIGLPSQDPDNLGYLKVSADLAEATVEVDLNAEIMPEERFQVVLFYNHEIYKSNELVFTNESQITDSNLASLNDYITIKHGDKSQDVYQDYTITNTLLNAAERYYPRKLYIDFILSDGTLANSQLAKSQIYWYIPNRSTMLSYDLEDLKKLNEDNNFLNDSVINKDGNNEIHSEHYRPNYTCFYKTIAPTATDEMSEEEINALITKDLFFSYRIKDYYSPAFSQNMIQCKIVKDDKVYEAELLFTFASYGTSGTDYTLCISPAGRQAAITPENNIASKAWKVNVALYNGKNEEVPITACTATIQHQGANAAVQSPIEIKDPNTNAIIGYNLIYNNSSVNTPYCGILQLTDIPVVYNNMDIKLTGYFPIPYAANKEYFMEGANSIIYNSAGIDPKYYRDAYVLYDQTAKAPVNGEWSAAYIHRKGAGAQFSDEDKVDQAFLPTIVEKKLLPCNMYVDTRTEDENGNLRSWSDWMPYAVCQQNGTIFWTTPILIIQNRYPSAMLNAWDGSLQIDEKNGTIMSTMMGAGRKTKNNTFEGVLMGDIKTGAGIEEESLFNYDNKTGMGIYGFNDGAQSFGFNIDGTAFIGKSGRGRILMDGNKGQISSASYQSTRLLDGKPNQQPTKDTDLISGFTQAAGMMIDLDDGIIDIRGTAIEEEKDENGSPTGNTKYVVEDLEYVNQDSEEQSTDPNIGEIKVEKDENGNLIVPQQSHIRIDAKSPYFTITSIQGKDLVSIGNKGYFIQSDNYVPFEFKENVDTSTEEQEEELTDGYGMKIDLHQGSIDAYNLKITSKTFFVNSRKDATANFIVRDPSTNKNLINMGILKPNENGSYPTEEDKIKNIWYLQSGNYTIAEFDENNKLKENTGSGMKIDLGTGQIDAYNFKLTSKNVFIDSTKDAKAIFAVKDNNDKYLVYLGVQPEEQTDLSNIWYFQSSNYISQADSTEEAAAAGMKIDLGTGLIDAYNFKLTSKNVFIDSTKDATTYFEIKAQNTVANALQTIFKVNNDGATLAGWTVDNNSIRIGSLGVGPKDMTDTSTEHSMWLCSTGTGSSTPSDFVGGAGSGWCLTIGRNFGVNKAGEMFGRGVTIKEGDIEIYQTLDSAGNTITNPELVFQASRKGNLFAKMGQIGQSITTGLIYINGHTIANGDGVRGQSGSVFFMKDTHADPESANEPPESIEQSLMLDTVVGGLANNNFYIGTGGIIMRPESPFSPQTTGDYSGIRLTGSGLQVEGCPSGHSSNEGPWCSTYFHGEGMIMRYNSQIFGANSATTGTQVGSLEYDYRTTTVKLTSFTGNNLFLHSFKNLDIQHGSAGAGTITGDNWIIPGTVKLNGYSANIPPYTWQKQVIELDTLFKLLYEKDNMFDARIKALSNRIDGDEEAGIQGLVDTIGNLEANLKSIQAALNAIKQVSIVTASGSISNSGAFRQSSMSGVDSAGQPISVSGTDYYTTASKGADTTTTIGAAAGI